MPIILTQTDNAGECPLINTAGCDTSDINGATSLKEATSGGTAGVTAVSLTQDAVIATKQAIGFTSKNGEPNSTACEPGTWTVRLEITTANKNLDDLLARVCRKNDLCNPMDAFGSVDLDLGDVATTGVKSASQSLTPGGNPPSASDQIHVVIKVHNSTAMTQTFAYKPSQNIDTPVNQGNWPHIRSISAGLEQSAFVAAFQA